MSAVWTWIKAWCGRLAASIGFLAASIDLDQLPTEVAPAADYIREIVGHRGLAWIMSIAFLFSIGRHQFAAMKVKKLQAQLIEVQAAHDELLAKQS